MIIIIYLSIHLSNVGLEERRGLYLLVYEVFWSIKRKSFSMQKTLGRELSVISLLSYPHLYKGVDDFRV